MKILVAIKRVIDPYVKIRVKSDGSGVVTDNVKMAMNPFCEIAVEEAVRLKEANQAEEVIVVSIGDSSCQEQLRTALALGADRAIHVNANNDLEPLCVAKILKKIIEQQGTDLVLLGKQSIDSDNNQVPQMLAALIAWPQATFASKVVVKEESIEVTREVDGGLETLALKLPAIVSTDLRLNEPRYASLPNIMKAKRKPMDEITPDSLGVEINASQTVLEVMSPPVRCGGEQLESVASLVEKLEHRNVLK